MQTDRLITIAIHTYERALQLKDLLERHHIEAILQNINLENPTISSGMRVRIKESDLANALLIIESEYNQDAALTDSELNLLPQILVPIDFSNYSVEAMLTALRLAQRHGACVVMLHTFLPEHTTASRQLSKVLNYDALSESEEEIAEAQAHEFMTIFMKKIKDEAGEELLQKVKIKSVIKRGIPEEVILQESRDYKPILIIMGTRGIDKKERDMVGSVTAEVLDSCRQPVLTIPEGLKTSNIITCGRVLFFCNGEQTDILAIHKLYELLQNKISTVKLVQMHNKWESDDNSSLMQLCSYCKDHFPDTKFEGVATEINNVEERCRAIERDERIDLIVVPNKKRSAFARLFNPGLAHKILFNADIALMAIPV